MITGLLTTEPLQRNPRLSLFLESGVYRAEAGEPCYRHPSDRVEGGKDAQPEARGHVQTGDAVVPRKEDDVVRYTEINRIMCFGKHHSGNRKERVGALKGTSPLSNTVA